MLTTEPGRPVALAGLHAVPVDLVDPGTNRRGPLGDIAGLMASIEVLGQLEPATLIEKPGGRYEVYEGHRRHAALVRLGRPHILAVVRQTPPPDEALGQAAIHATRREFDPIALARVFSEAMFERGRSREDIAAAVGRTPEFVRDRIALLELAAHEREQVAAGTLPVTAALAILRERRRARDRPAGGPAAPPAAARQATRQPARAATKPAARPAARAACSGTCAACGAACGGAR